MKKMNKITMTLEPSKLVFDEIFQETLIDESKVGLSSLSTSTKDWVEAIKINIDEMERGNYLLANTRMAQVVNEMRVEAEAWEHLRKCFAVNAQNQSLKAIINPNKQSNENNTRGIK